MTHCEMFQAGDIQAVIGDASRDGVGGTQYCGVWSLTTKRRVFNAFGNSYAGLIPGVIRGKAPRLEVTGDASCALVREAGEDYPVDARATYELSPPHYVDHTLEFTDRRDVRGAGCDFREVSWCCYMNCPDDTRIHFLSGGEWFRYISPEHGVGSNIAPSYVPDTELEVYPQVEGRRPFHWDRIQRRFDRPFYYGRVGDHVLILLFDTPRWLRFFCSPSGGGGSMFPGRACPAWDFEWIIPADAYQVGRRYEFRMRMVYKPYVSDDDVVEEHDKAVRELGFETVS
jgi:hypothetical protein